ncbi:RTA1 like protein-domain-containing protein [Lentinula detonsa]|uniref:RTA1 like protein-domain-containing protein n=1 Tax=Lentinula detonsa TaxID=2804962 RepID=A0A9W8NU54_9AGAR|nr:RTA1 like protein-domain-containing protein [Lentinula detonsa]
MNAGATRNVALIFGYVPNQTAAIIAAAFYFCFGTVLTFHIVRLKNLWALALPIGTLGSGLGFITRYILAEPAYQTSKTTMIIEEVLTLCFPAGFLAFNYIVYGRLVLYCVGARHSLIRPQWVSTFFIMSDISTFVIQASLGAAFVVQPEHHDLGEKIVEVGVVLQTISFGIFSAMLLLTYASVRRERSTNGTETWWRAYQAVAFSSTFIVIRSIYRMISSIDGSSSVIATTEIYLYLLDVLPLMIAIGVYIPFWPGSYTTGEDSILHISIPEQHKLSSVDAGSRELLASNEA